MSNVFMMVVCFAVCATTMHTRPVLSGWAGAFGCVYGYLLFASMPG